MNCAEDKLDAAYENLPTFSAENVLHGKIYEVEKENVGVEAGHKGERIAESAVRHTTRKIHSAYRQHHLKPYQEVEKA